MLEILLKLLTNYISCWRVYLLYVQPYIYVWHATSFVYLEWMTGVLGRDSALVRIRGQPGLMKWILLWNAPGAGSIARPVDQQSNTIPRTVLRPPSPGQVRNTKHWRRYNTVIHTLNLSLPNSNMISFYNAIFRIFSLEYPCSRSILLCYITHINAFTITNKLYWT